MQNDIEYIKNIIYYAQELDDALSDLAEQRILALGDGIQLYVQNLIYKDK